MSGLLFNFLLQNQRNLLDCLSLKNIFGAKLITTISKTTYRLLLSALVLSVLFLSFHTADASVDNSLYSIKRGDTFYSILQQSFTENEILEINREIKKEVKQFVLRPGMKVQYDTNKIVLTPNSEQDIIIEKTPENIEKPINVTVKNYTPEVINVVVKGKIENNLFDTMRKIGEDAELAAMFAEIFEWEVDFLKEVYNGDEFYILVEKKFVRNEYAGYGKILAADFVNRGNRKRAVYYGSGKNAGYYNEEGKSYKRGFLRVPLNYSRISSRYTNSRLHPVLGYYRPHYGVDYAAPIGTPVKATADGVVKARARAKGNGNYIVLKHSNGYETFYLHLNSFNRRTIVGRHVKQGQIIGYVGSTGYSTGPHLDYRIKKDGRWLNPLKFVARAKVLKKEEVNQYLEYADSYFRKLDVIGTHSYAYINTNLSYGVHPTNSMSLLEF